MSRRAFLAACASLLTAVPAARAQTPEPPPSIPLAAAATGGDPSDPTGLYPALRPTGVATDLPGGGCSACGRAGHDLWTRPTLTGDWCGWRPNLRDDGVQFNASVTQFGFGLNGGVNRTLPGLPLGTGNTGAYTGRGDYELLFDLEKFGGLPKGKLLVRAQNWWGQYGNITPNTGAFPPAVFPAALPPVPNDPGVPYLTDFLLTQPLTEHLVLFAGKKNVIGAADQDDFAGGNGTVQFMNQAFIANPAFLLALPYTSFTAGVVSPQEWGAVSAYVYDPQNRVKDFFRVGDLFSQGVIVGTEVKVKTDFFSLPGQQHVGGIWKHVELSNLAFDEPPPGVYPYTAVPGSPTLNDSYTIYYGFDQYVRVYSEETKRGWGVFGRASISDGNPTPIRYFLSAGVGGYSPFRHRQGDQFGVGVYYTGLSQSFGPRPTAVFGPRDGWGLEAFYNAKLTPWMSLAPDFQIVKPEAGRIAETAYIGGVRLKLDF